MIANALRLASPLFAVVGRLLAIVALLVLPLASSAAQSPTAGEPSASLQVTLTPDQVERFIDSWPDFEALGDKLAESHGVDESVTDPTSAFASWAKSADAKSQIDAVVAKHGFASLDDWSGVAASVMLAFSYDAQELSEERVAEVVAEIEASPQVPADQKAAAIAQLREYVTAARAMAPLPGNVDTIEPYLVDLAAIAGGQPVEPGEPTGEPGATQD